MAIVKLIKINDYTLSFVPFNCAWNRNTWTFLWKKRYCCTCMIAREGVMTQRRVAILDIKPWARFSKNFMMN